MVISDEKFERLEDMAREINEKTDDSLRGKTKRTIYLGYVIGIGGSTISKYQKRLAKAIGWKEKNLTTANAVIGLANSALFYWGAWEVGDNLGGGLMVFLYSYPTLNTLQSIVRISYSQFTGKSLPSISLSAAVGTLGYVLEDLVRGRKKPVETRPLQE